MRFSASLAAFLASLPAVARGYTADVGNVAVIEDTTGAIHNTEGFWGPDQLCREAAKIFYRCHADEYDGFVAFTAKPVTTIEDQIRNVQQGTPVQNAVDGIGYSRFNFTAQYGSAGRLQQCVSMASLSSIPDDPDGPATAFLGLPLGLTGVELLGHEFGHRWLLGVEFDKNDGMGRRHLLRGFENDSPNLHYSAWADSRSVMYGSFITDNGDGTFTACGGERGFNPLDQYLMGLRPASEVTPLLVLDDGSGQGNPAVAMPRGTCNNLTGFTRVDVTIDDVVRAMGPRTPADGQSPRNWRLAFLLVTEMGRDATPAQVAKVDRYRTRFASWFPAATGNRGSVDTTLGPWTCVDGGLPPDAGTPKPPEDGGVTTVDAGAGAPDAGSGAKDGGGEDAGTARPDGGVASDAGAPGDAGVRDAGPGSSRDAGVGRGGAATGCSCHQPGSAPTPLVLLFALALLAARRLRAPR